MYNKSTSQNNADQTRLKVEGLCFCFKSSAKLMENQKLEEEILSRLDKKKMVHRINIVNSLNTQLTIRGCWEK